MHPESSDPNTIQVAVDNVPKTVSANTEETVHLHLLNDTKPLTLNDLKLVHTKKIHVMVIDPDLTDYHHVHPVMDAMNKDFVFKFTPKKNGAYRIWVDITPIATNKQMFLHTDIGFSAHKPLINKKVILDSTSNSYQFKMKLSAPPETGKPLIATITVTKNGMPFKQLEPVMGAFAHLMGFNANYSSIVHIHPMGKEPQKDSDRGGSQLMFHMEPQTTGFVKLFAQFRIDGKDVYVPFGITVS